MPYFGTRILTNLGVAPLKEFHLQMLIRVFKEVARPTLCREKIGKSWHETVVLAALGQFCKELVEGWIPSTTTWSRACAWFARIVLGQQEGCSLPNCISGRSPDFFSTLCALLSQFCDHNVRPEPILPSLFLALYHSESCIFPLHS